MYIILCICLGIQIHGIILLYVKVHYTSMYKLELRAVIVPDPLLSTCRKRSLPRDDSQASEPPAKRGRRKRKGKTSKSKQNKAANEVEELPHMSQTALQVESPPSTPQTDQPSPAEMYL